MSITALEIRADEVTPYDPARAKALRAKLWGAVIQPKPIVIPKPLEPVAPTPREEMARTLYAFPIGPKQIFQRSYVGPVVYKCQARFNLLRRCRHYAQKVRAPHELDAYIYPRPIGPHNTMDFVYVAPVIPNRDWLKIGSRDRLSSPSAKQIIVEVCKEHHIHINELLSRRRNADLVLARQHAAHRLRYETMLSLPQIGRMLKRDHTSILHNLKVAEKLIMGGKLPDSRACAAISAE